MNQIKNVSICTGGGGASAEPLVYSIHHGGDTFISHNYWRSCCDNITKFDGQH